MSNPARIIVALCLVAALGLVACSPRDAEPPALEPSSSLKLVTEGAAVATHLEATLPGLIEAARIPGISMCLIVNGNPAWCGQFGTRDAATASPVDETTLFEAASLSKPVFAYAVLRLVDRGVLDLDTPLVEYIGEPLARSAFLGEGFDDTRFLTITARMVLSHTSGFPNWRRNGALAIRFEPGSRFSYSGEGFGYLQQVVEKLTGKSLEEIARDEVFEPLGMASSTFALAGVTPDRCALRHDGLGQPVPLPGDFEKLAAGHRPHAAATLLTTAADYATFLTALMRGTGLEKATHAEMLRPQIELERSEQIAWGLGTGLQLSDDGVAAWHWGDNENAKAFFLVHPYHGLGLVYFANGLNGLGVYRYLCETAIGGSLLLADSNIMDGYYQHDSQSFRFSTAVFEGGADAALALVHELQGGLETSLVSEAVVNRMGYWLLRNDRASEAVRLFKLNTELYPASSNVYDSLGEGLMDLGDTEAAIANYRRSLELDPDNDNARDKLREMGAGS